MLHKYLKKLNHWVSELQKLRWALINVRLGPDTRWNKIHNTEFQSRRFETSKHDKHGSNASDTATGISQQPLCGNCMLVKGRVVSLEELQAGAVWQPYPALP